MSRRVNVLGVKFDDITSSELENILRDAFDRFELLRIVTPNPEIVMAAESAELKKLINDSGLVLKDGIGIKLAERLRHVDGRPRLTGIDTLKKLLQLSDEKQGRVYIVGSKQEVLDKAIKKISEAYPAINIVGSHNGYFKEGSEDEEHILNDIKEKKPNVVVVAMGFPKQEKFMARLDRRCASVTIGCGGSLDVISGNIKRAPLWMQRCGTEWLYRLIKEPSRIKRQTVIPKFLIKIITNKNSCVMEDSDE